jgi:hypothetical protein
LRVDPSRRTRVREGRAVGVVLGHRGSSFFFEFSNFSGLPKQKICPGPLHGLLYYKRNCGVERVTSPRGGELPGRQEPDCLRGEAERRGGLKERGLKTGWCYARMN